MPPINSQQTRKPALLERLLAVRPFWAVVVATATTRNKDSIKTRFGKMDANNDGRITEDEFNQLTAMEK